MAVNCNVPLAETLDVAVLTATEVIEEVAAATMIMEYGLTTEEAPFTAFTEKLTAPEAVGMPAIINGDDEPYFTMAALYQLGERSRATRS